MSFRGRGRFSETRGGRQDDYKRETAYKKEDVPPFKRRYEDGGDTGNREDYKRRFQGDGRSQSQEIPLISNAFKISRDPNTFIKLHIFNIVFTGDRHLKIYDENFKRRLFSQKAIITQLKTPYLVSYRNEDGIDLFILGDESNTTQATVNSLSGLSIPLKTKAKDGSPQLEEWTVQCKELNTSPLINEDTNATLWIQFLTILSQTVMCEAGYTSLMNETRLVRMGSRESWKPLAKANGHLVPGFAKALTLAENGAFWTFAPRWTVLLQRTFHEYMSEAVRDQPKLEDVVERGRWIKKRRVFAVTAYNPANVYQVLNASDDIKATDKISIRVKQSNGEFADEETTHLDYLRSRYARDFPALNDPGLERVPMVCCALVGRKKKAVRNAKTVHIPATLLHLINMNASDFSKALREEITRMSQRKADQVVRDLIDLTMDLTKPSIRDAFQVFGLSLDPQPTKLKGHNNLQQTVVVTITPNEDSKEPLRELRLEPETGSFEREFQTVLRHACNPIIGNKFMMVVHVNVEDRVIDDFFRYMSHKTSSLHWDLQMGHPSQAFIIRFQTEADLGSKVLDLLRDFDSKRIVPPKIIFGLIPSKDEANYSAIKRFAYRLDVPSQVVTRAVLDRLQGKPFWKITASLAGKMAPIIMADNSQRHAGPWRLRDPPLGARPNTTAIGIASYTTSETRQSQIGGFGITATSNVECTSIVQEFGLCDANDRSGLLTNLRAPLRAVLHNLKIRKKRPLDNLVIYRRGVSASSFDRLELELKQIDEAICDVVGSQEWNAKSNVLTLRYPAAFTERGTYTVELIGVKTSESAKPLRLRVQVEATAEQEIQGTKLRVSLKVPIKESDGVYDTNARVIVTKPNGQKLQMPKKPMMAFIVANHCHSANLQFFKDTRPGPPDSRRQNCLTPCGTLVDKFFRSVDPSISKVARDEFYIVPGPGPVGFSLPVHYCVLKNTLQMSIRELEDISLRLSYLYFNQQGSVKCPWILKVAEKAAEQATTIYRDIEDVVKEDEAQLLAATDNKKRPAAFRRLKDTTIFL